MFLGVIYIYNKMSSVVQNEAAVQPLDFASQLKNAIMVYLGSTLDRLNKLTSR